MVPANGTSDLTMKAKHKAKAKAKTRSKPKTKAKTKAKAKGTRTTRAITTTRPSPITPPALSSDFKTCEEVEVGDIGGFGITSEERMERETRCPQRATQFCTNCQRNVCNTHYELLHKDHDLTVRHDSGQNPVQV